MNENKQPADDATPDISPSNEHPSTPSNHMGRVIRPLDPTLTAPQTTFSPYVVPNAGATAPLSQVPQSQQPQPARILSAKPIVARKHVSRRTAYTIAAVVVGIYLAVIGSVGFVAFHLLNDHISDKDLASATYDGASFLYPKKWIDMSANGSGTIRQYQSLDLIHPNDPSLIALSSTQLPVYYSTFMKSGDPKYEDFMRTLLGQQMSTASVSALGTKIHVTCDPSHMNIKTTTVIDALANGINIGYTTATCTDGTKSYGIKLRMVVGSEGKLRLLTIASPTFEWKKNQDVYDKILASLTLS